MPILELDTFDEDDNGRTIAQFMIEYEEMELWQLDALEQLGLVVW